MKINKTTIQKQITINVILPVVTALALIAVINYISTNRILNNASESKSKLISEEIKNILQFQDFTLNLIERNFDNDIEVTSNYLVYERFEKTNDIADVNLTEILKERNLDPEIWAIYVINQNGIIVNTTFKPDSGMSFFEFGPTFVEFLPKVFEGKKLVKERLATEKNSSRKRKYSYHPTLDGKYIVQLGVYSDDATLLLENFKKQLNAIAEKQQSIVSVDLFVGYDNPISFNSEHRIDPNRLKAYQKAIDQKTKTKVDDKANNLVYEFVYLDRKNTDLYKGSAIRIITDKSSQVAEVRSELVIFVVIFGFTMAILLVLIIQRSRKITEPIKDLAVNVLRITAGNLNERAEVKGNNEITTLSQKFNQMLDRLEESYNDLERKVIERTQEISQQKEEIEAQRDVLAKNNQQLELAYREIEEQKQRITDSIMYAQKIQKVILPPLDYVAKVLPEAFVIYMPKDIVSGDFYWITKKHNQVNFAAVDCTGHGVPGAFMSLVGNNNLNMAVSSNELKNPAQILDLLNQGVTDVLRQKDDESEIRDGMDIALCSIDAERKTLQFAGAYRPLYLLREGELTEIKGDKFPIGGSTWNVVKSFTNHVINIQKGDCIYIFSDGYTDQFGGPDGKKFMPKRLKAMLKKIYKLDKDFQEETIRKAFDDWKGNEEQLDDVMVIGLKF